MPKEDEEAKKQYQPQQTQTQQPRTQSVPRSRQPDADPMVQRETAQGKDANWDPARAVHQKQKEADEARPWYEKMFDPVKEKANDFADWVYKTTGQVLEKMSPEQEAALQQKYERQQEVGQTGAKGTTSYGDKMQQAQTPQAQPAGTPAEQRDKAYMDNLRANRTSQAGIQDQYLNSMQQAYAGQKDINQTYLDQIKGLNDKMAESEAAYQKNQQSLSDQAASQATDARKTYTDLRSKQANLMDQRISNANQALSLKDASDPNNAVAVATRNLYNTEADRTAALGDTYGNQIRSEYDTLANKLSGNYGNEIAATQKRGMADAGTLAALGAQATANQSYGNTMTGSQLAALSAGNQSQSQQAYTNAMQRVKALEDQRRALNETLSQQGLQTAQTRRAGLQDTAVGQRNTGLGQSLAQSWQNFGAGQQERDAAASLASQLASQDINQLQAQQGLRTEQSGYGTNMLNSLGRTDQLGRDYSDLSYLNKQSLAQNDMDYAGLLNQTKLGQLQGQRSDIQTEQDLAMQREAFNANKDALAAQLAEARAQREEQNKLGAYQGLGSTAGGIIGGIYGGPMGAAAGSQIGSGFGGLINRIVG